MALLAAAASWGSTFFLIHGLVSRVPVLDFLGIRFTMATIVLALLAPRSLRRLGRAEWRHGVVLGALYGCAQILQTFGLAHTSPSVSGFITGMYVVATPLFGFALLHTRILPLTWLAVVMAMVGLGVLTLSGVSVGIGEAVTLASALLYALHVVGLGRWSSAEQAIGMTIVQSGVIALICTVAALPGGVVWPSRTGDWLSIGYMAVFAAALALLAQTWAQAHLPATRSAIIMSTEPVWAAVFAVLLGTDQLTWRLVVGGGLILAAMVLAELLPRRKVEAEVPHLAV